jgi:hypothetical protein
MRVGIYARVSTLIGQSPEIQLAELRECAARRGWEIYCECVDSGISGSKESRAELNRLMSDVHLRRFDVGRLQRCHLDGSLPARPGSKLADPIRDKTFTFLCYSSNIILKWMLHRHPALLGCC